MGCTGMKSSPDAFVCGMDGFLSTTCWPYTNFPQREEKDGLRQEMPQDATGPWSSAGCVRVEYVCGG